MRPVRYHDLVFQPDLLVAQRDDGTTIRLTRQERALLMRLVRQPETLVTRDQLLTALDDEAGRLGERSVDYVVNRLRRRLGDSARKPRFIATQYGEGYAWMAQPLADEPFSAFLVIGPVFGLGSDGHVLPMLERLAAAIRTRLGPGRTVACRPDWHPDPLTPGAVRFSLEASSHEEDGHIHLAMVLRDGTSQRVVEAQRRTIRRQDAHRETDELAAAILDAMWRDAAGTTVHDPAPGERPIYLRMHDAAMMLTSDRVSWRENEPRLRLAHQARPADPGLRVLLALNGYARLLQSLADIDDMPLDDEAWAAQESEMEVLALGAIEEAAGNPMLLLGIAKVLHFVDRGHTALAARLTQEAFLATTAFAACFAMKAQLATSGGDIDAALAFYDKAVELAEENSQFHIYLLVLKAMALAAAGRRGPLDRVTAELYERDPPSRIALGIFFVSAKARVLPAHLDEAIGMSSPELARNVITHLYRIGGRYFPRKAQRRNLLGGMATQFARRHGTAAIPQRFQSLGLLR